MTTRKAASPKSTRRATKPPARTKRAPAKRELALWEKIVARGKRIPADELANHPTDGARELEPYLCGADQQDE
jgi:hypothetical protein